MFNEIFKVVKKDNVMLPDGFVCLKEATDFQKRLKLVSDETCS